MERKDLQAVEEIFPQLAFGDGFLGDAVGGGDHAYVGLDELGYRKYKPSLW